MGACPADTLEGRSPGLAVFVTQNAPSCSLPSPAALREPGARALSQSRACVRAEPGPCISAVLLPPAACPREGSRGDLPGSQAGAPVAPSRSWRVACPDVFVSQGSLRGSVFMRRGGDDVFFVSLN